MKKLTPALALFIILIPVLITNITGIKTWKNNINADGYGYYAYLPCFFIYHHLDFERVKAEEHKLRKNLSNEEVDYPFPAAPGNTNKLMDKYFVGTSVLMAPFFLLAYFLSYLFGLDLSGYSVLFQVSVALAAFFYLIIGLIYLRKLMLEYKASDKVIYACLILILYGTNLYYYATSEPSLSHIYSFALCAVFLYFSKRAIEKPALRPLLVMAITFGLLLIIRPTNIFILFGLPFLAGDLKKALDSFTRIAFSRYIILMLLAFLVIVSIQLFTWHAETSRWLVWSYPGETFTFASPHIIDFLFSYRKGWFIYTPMMFFILTASTIMFFLNKNYFSAIIILLFTGVVVYVSSCWQPWWYGGSFGMRPLIDFYPFFALLLCLLLSRLSVRGTIVLAGILSLCLIVSVIQTIQYTKFIFSFDKMNKHRYWEIFLKTGDEYGWLYENPGSKLDMFDAPRFLLNFDKDTATYTINHEIPYDGPGCLQLTSTPVTLISLQAASLPKLTGVWIYEKFRIYSRTLPTNANLLLEVKTPDGKIVFSHAAKFEDAMGGPDEWEKVEFINELPSLSAEDIISISAQSSNNGAYLDNTEVRFGLKHQ